MNRKVSVIISVYNGENYLKEAILSALEQDYKEKEIIVVNDGSQDRTKEILQEFENQISIITQENKGLGAGRNTAIRFSTGDYLAFLDHDDLWEKTKLSKQMKEMALLEKDNPLIFSQAQQFICSHLNEEERKKISVNESVLPGYIAGTLLISRERFDQIGYFLEKKQVGEFIDWYLRALEKNVPIVLLYDVTLYRRVHQNNMGRQKDLYKQTDYLKILKASLDRRRKCL